MSTPIKAPLPPISLPASGKFVVYYAHPLSLYGAEAKPNLQEQRDVAMLRSMGFDVLNPNGPQHEDGYNVKGGMEYFRDLVQNQTQILAFRPFVDGSIPAGIAKEIQMAQEVGHPVFELPNGLNRRMLGVDATREMLKDHGCR